MKNHLISVLACGPGGLIDSVVACEVLAESVDFLTSNLSYKTAKFSRDCLKKAALPPSMNHLLFGRSAIQRSIALQRKMGVTLL